eukprot:TRINITY_DN2402_c0_g1_i7.p1 TRINITY_DN2402_c0_g1~~TRINITY_DN2402_c0_g1_i7.p1  ORF type:complete len:307 (+),score=68.73 TRINITY_DN2402_c0_g1_i7:55-975(+)
MVNHVKYFAIVRFNDNLPLYTHALETAIAEDCKKNAVNLSRKLGSANLQPEERQKVKNDKGNWYCTVDNNRILYAVLVEAGYQERYSYMCIKEFQDIIFKKPDYHLGSDAEVTKLLKGEGEKILKKYNDPAAWDKLAAAQKNVDELTGVVENDIRKMTDNAKQLDNLQGKTEKMKNVSKEFQKNTKEVKDIMWWRNMKLMIILAVLIIGGAGFAVWWFFFKQVKNCPIFQEQESAPTLDCTLHLLHTHQYPFAFYISTLLSCQSCVCSFFTICSQLISIITYHQFVALVIAYRFLLQVSLIEQEIH